MALKVLHTIESASLGGAERLALGIALGMEGRGYQPVFAVPGEGWLAKTLKRREIEFFPLPARESLDLGFLRWLIKLLRREKIDLVHAHMMAMNLYGSLAARRAHIPCVATLHGRLYDLEKPRRRMVYKFVSRQASCLVTVAEELKQALVGEVGIDPRKIMTVPNGVDIPPLHSLAGPLDVNTGAIVVTVGSLKEVKGQRYLIQAFAGVHKEFPRARLLIVGDGPCRQQLEELCFSLGLEGVVSLLGTRDDVSEIIAGANVFVFPSLSEGQSLSLMEAMGAGLPVIATSVGGNVEIVRPGETGLLVPPRSPGQLAAAINTLLHNPKTAYRMGQAGRKRAELEFSREAMLNRYQELYNNLLPSPPAGGGKA
jgi:glycosyltransferase involved in cell wall biosynthesis